MSLMLTDVDNLREAIARGDREAFARLYRAIGDRLHHYATMLLGSREAAEDVVQETFVRLVRSRERLSDVERLSAYVFQIARNEAMRAMRRQSRGPNGTRAGAELLFEIPSNGDPRADRERAEWIAAAVLRLPEKRREVVELKVYGGLTLAEIAEVTGRPPGTVASQYRTALSELRDLLNEDETPCPSESKSS